MTIYTWLKDEISKANQAGREERESLLLEVLGANMFTLDRSEGSRIFSGDYSDSMWNAINKAKSKSDLRWALYLVCCRLQELETMLARHGIELNS